MRVGCCGFPVRREEYYSKFDIVEVQSTFYNLPRPSTAIRWRAEAPAGFDYILKAWQPITHPSDSPTYTKTRVEIPQSKAGSYGFFKPTDEVHEAWERTRETARILDSRMILFQCPPRFEENADNLLNMRTFFENVERGRLKLLWEPRGRWNEDTIKSLCRDFNLIHCVDPFCDNQVHGGIAYYRLHGKGGYGYQYTDSDLTELLGMCPKDKDSYVMFNNMSMLEDALRFKFLCRGKQ